MEAEDAVEAKAGGADPPAIFATAIAKYVFKQNRLTIPPERILRASNLLPGSESGTVAAGESLAGTDPAPAKSSSAGGTTAPAEEWTWARVEAERERGMKVAEHFAALEGLNGEFRYEGDWALGEYADLF